jgi:hypothetical protein
MAMTLPKPDSMGHYAVGKSIIYRRAGTGSYVADSGKKYDTGKKASYIVLLSPKGFGFQGENLMEFLTPLSALAYLIETCGAVDA